MPTAPAHTISLEGLSLGHRKFHKWASQLTRDDGGFVLVYGPASATPTPWGDRLPTVDETVAIVRYNPTTGQFTVDVVGRNAYDTKEIELPDGRKIKSMNYPQHWDTEFTIHDLPAGTKSFLTKAMSLG